LPLFLPALLLAACAPREESIARPPETPPLSREVVGEEPVIGYGVVNASYTHLRSEPGENGVSLGYVRMGSIVKLLERRLMANDESWVFAEGEFSGWLPETELSIFESEDKAKTAALQRIKE